MNTEFLAGSHLPDELQGAVTKSVYIASYVELHRFSDDASGFKAEPLGHLIESPSNVFRPLETKVGPDGAIYVCDWYNPIIGHYQASYRDPNRDHTHGRIWRLTAKDRPLVKPPALADMTAAQLIEQLATPERWVREQARRLLYFRSPRDVLPALDAHLAALTGDDKVETQRVLLAAMGIYSAHEQVKPAVLQRLLDSPEPRLRAFGTHMIGLWADGLSEPIKLLRTMAGDDYPRVRLEAIVAASYISAPQALEAAAVAIDKPRDKFIDYALAQTVRVLKKEWYPALERGELRFDDQPNRLRAVLEADGTKDVAGFVRKLADNNQLTPAAREQLWALLVNVGSPDDLRLALDRQSRSPLVLATLMNAAAVHRKIPSGNLVDNVRSLLSDPDESQQIVGLRLAGVWNTAALKGDIRTILEQSSSIAKTAAALSAIAALEGRDALPVLTKYAAPRSQHPCATQRSPPSPPGT